MSHSKRYVIFKLNDDLSKIVVDCEGGKSETYDDFKGKLPSDDCRYGVVDFDFKYPDGRENNKIVFVFWTPDNAKTKSKMIYASTKETFKKTVIPPTPSLPSRISHAVAIVIAHRPLRSACCGVLQLVGLGIDMQATDMGEVDVKEVLDKIGDGAMLK